MSDLKPCPFCGGDCSEKYNDMFSAYSVSCDKCGEGDLWNETASQAIAAWNTRPIEERLASDNARLREVLKRLVDEICRQGGSIPLNTIEYQSALLDARTALRIAREVTKEASNG